MEIWKKEYGGGEGVEIRRNGQSVEEERET